MPSWASDPQPPSPPPTRVGGFLMRTSSERGIWRAPPGRAMLSYWLISPFRPFPSTNLPIWKRGEGYYSTSRRCRGRVYSGAFQTGTPTKGWGFLPLRRLCHTGRRGTGMSRPSQLTPYWSRRWKSHSGRSSVSRAPRSSAPSCIGSPWISTTRRPGRIRVPGRGFTSPRMVSGARPRRTRVTLDGITAPSCTPCRMGSPRRRG